MVYLDTSALIKRYLKEAGSDVVQARFARAKQTGERIFTSALSYAEILTVLGRKVQSQELTPENYGRQADSFVNDWLLSMNVLEVDTNIMSALRDITSHFPLKAADAVHLSAVLWLRETCRMVPEFAAGDTALEFGVTDRSLARVASQCGLAVFNPETMA